ncbi:hypothetical protein [Halobacillus naozhouensis]|uniref:Uncharacterized protein n=1 Tax=Halobacillus naozhouensis TaxID=554880 RepID=A0ABY8IY53_9BACI|nr:hypothetical protein [Halobacillus naozhouensis]WFT74224.1 hypothetical protein P9989_17945 [Halobacillus naozhouensis]
MKWNKLTFSLLTVILSAGLLTGCGNATEEQEPAPNEQQPTDQNYEGGNNDEQEPDPTEEPSEQQNQNNDEQEPDPSEEPSEQQNQGDDELDEEQNNNNG